MNDSPKWSQLLLDAVNKPGQLLAAYSAFHNYSIGNQLLALAQCQGRGLTPGPMSTFPGWKDRGRFVKKGEKAIWLCMPMRFGKKDDPDSQRLGFAFKPRWFVLAQTEGQDYEPPALPEWERARALAALGVSEVTFDHTDGNVQGYAKQRQIAVSPLAALPHKTTFHELGHVVLGHTSEADFSDDAVTPRNLREVEAEAVALICCETLGLDGADYCRGYIQNWNASGEPIPEQSAQKIFRAADLILKAGAPPAEREAEDEQA